MKKTIYAVIAAIMSLIFLTGCSSFGADKGSLTGNSERVKAGDATGNNSSAGAGASAGNAGGTAAGVGDSADSAGGTAVGVGDSADSSGGTATGVGSSTEGSSGNGADTAGTDADSTVAGASTSDASNEKTNVVIVIDPGHGGRYPGAEYNNCTEKKITLTVSKYVRDILINEYDGVEVYLTRDADVTLDDDLKLDLELRAICAEEHNADALVSIHFNASEKHNMHGTTVFVSRREQVKQVCYGLASSIMESFVALGLKNCGIETRKSNDMFDETGDPYDYYAINRHCAARNIPGIIVEQCFMDNDTDYAFFSSDEALYALALADATGIAKYYNLPKKQ